jgi:hypothetical protein
MNKTTFLVPVKIVDKPYKTIAGEEIIPQPDILYMDSVFVSTGDNKNDDVFLPEEMWKARNTPRYKPVDWEHETGSEVSEEEFSKNPRKPITGNQIIGVMYNAYVVDDQGNVIPNEKSSASDFKVPSKFHIVDQAMIWKSLFPTVAARIEKGAKENVLFVSMEAWFPKYDYQVGSKIVARNEQTAFLDKQLKANGGTGMHNQVPVKRVLRDFTFGGKGIVYRPANDASVIKSVTHVPVSAQASEVYNEKAIASNIIGELNSEGNKIKESDMADANTNQTPVVAGVSVEDYKAQVAKATQSEQDAKAAQAELASLKAKSAEADKKAAEELTAAKAKAEETAKKLAEAETKLAEVAKAAKLSERRGKIAAELKVDGDKLEKLLVVAKDMSDEAFASYLSSTKEILTSSEAAFMDFKKKKEEEDEKKKKEAKAEEEKAAAAKKAAEDAAKASVSEGITDPKILERITSPATPSPGVDSNNGGVDLKNAFASLATAVMNTNKRSQ